MRMKVQSLAARAFKRWVAAITTVVVAAGNAIAAPAFPGAEGYGANANGGRGGTVYHVTNLNDSGPGSLRTGIGTANRTIVFDVSGTIELVTDLKINKNNITIAGQTAPGDGICLKGRLVSVQDCRDVIVRFIRTRAGDVNCTTNEATTFQDDSFHLVNTTNVIIDHISSSWSIDECLSATWSTNVTVQWCMISESLKNSCHPKGAHGYGSLIRYAAGGVTYHHNLYADHDSRNPRPGDNIHLDFVNNVVYNWGGTAGYNADDTADNIGNPPPYFTNVLNYVSNYFLAGPSTTGHLTQAFDSGVTNAISCQIFQSGNRIDSNKNGSLDGTDTGWSMFGSPYAQLAFRFNAPQVTTDSALAAYEKVLAFVGASHARDAADSRVANDVRKQTGAIINSQSTVGGWPTLNSTTLPTDTDQDGIANFFELALGWNPAVANNNHTNTDGYTDLEWYLNWLAMPHTTCNRDGFVDVNLRNVIGVQSNFTFAVTAGTNGSAQLRPDGITARFTAANAYSGLASFGLFATNAGTGNSFGPTTVSVLISTTNANSAPVLVAIPNQALVAGATLMFTNSATDADVPAQTLTFGLLNSPAGASVNSTNGLFNWRPTIARGNSTNNMSVFVTDSGVPSLGATQSFSVVVNVPASPTVTVTAANPFSLTINGDGGPDYVLQTSTNLTDWATVFTTNSPPLPLIWIDANTSDHAQRFYRVLLGP